MQFWKDSDDAQLLNAAKQGAVEAFGELYERYAKLIYRYLFAHTHDRMEAEDLTEEVFLRVWRSLPDYREQGVPFGAYLIHVARNLKVDYYRRSKFLIQNFRLEDGDFQVFAPDPGETALDRLEQEELFQIMMGLREDYREVLVLRFISGFSPEETSQVMERSVGAVRVLQHRALAALREMLAGRQVE
jgi:RNA polymerase sigma-70 factor, ECF subfamily